MARKLANKKTKASDLAHDGVDAVPDAPEDPREDDPTPEADDDGQVRVDYDSHLRAVEELVEMTSTVEWQRRHAWIQREIKRSATALLECEKPKEIVAHQQKVRAFREFLSVLKQPVEEMISFCKDMPLFAGTFPKHASWNEALGRAELRENPTLKK